MRNFLLFSLLLFFLACKSQKNSKVEDIIYAPLDSSKVVQRIAFGSCNHEDDPQLMWEPILAQSPDLWIWLGDNIYGDSDDAKVLKAKYELQLSHEEYQGFIKTVPQVGIWDDHDYGVNDGDKTYALKKESKTLMLDFLNVPANAPQRVREGAYSSYLLGSGEQKVKVLLLDARYFRDPLERNPADDGQLYIPNTEGDILGEAQWTWLEEELRNSEAQYHIIGCGIQMIAAEHNFEKWANFPKARKRFFDLMEKTKPSNTILISGDRHITEISKIELEGLDYPLYDITSSGLTHSFERIREVGEINSHREGDKYAGDKNYGLFDIDWEKDQLKVEIRGVKNQLILETLIQY
ncbi:MAG: alkaline phosphatase D family protein [Bacteroidota bacterium]